MKLGKEVEEKLEKVLNCFGEHPRIILTGKTGAGKSSLINALLGQEVQETDVVPCTMDEAEIDWKAGNTDIKLVDVPGFAEADRHAERVNFILEHLPEAHVALLVIGAPDRALEHERQFLEDVRDTDKDYLILVAGNKIDLLPPARDWKPSSLNLDHPKTQSS